eukprot:1161590-Pelagomonas_calceolata.AAC.4
MQALKGKKPCRKPSIRGASTLVRKEPLVGEISCHAEGNTFLHECCSSQTLLHTLPTSTHGTLNRPRFWEVPSLLALLLVWIPLHISSALLKTEGDVRQKWMEMY